MEWIPIDNAISLPDLLIRWKGVKFDGEEISVETIDQLVSSHLIAAYDRKDWIPRGGRRVWRGLLIPAWVGLSGAENRQQDIIFDVEDIEKIEKELIPPQEDMTEGEGTREYITAEDLRKELGLSPAKFVEYLRVNREDFPLFGLLDEDRKWFYVTSREAAASMLADISIHHLDILEHKRKNSGTSSRGLQLVEEGLRAEELTAKLEVLEQQASDIAHFSLVEAEETRSLRQWNQRLHEQNKTLRAELAQAQADLASVQERQAVRQLDLNNAWQQDSPEAIIALATTGDEESAKEWIAEKDTLIAELKEQLAATTTESRQGERDNSAAVIGKLKKDVKLWKGALSMAVAATGKVLEVEATKKARPELLPFVCAVCPSKCDKPRTPCAMFSREQFEAWREALPPAHVDDTDRSAYPPNTVEVVEGEEKDKKS